MYLEGKCLPLSLIVFFSWESKVLHVGRVGRSDLRFTIYDLFIYDIFTLGTTRRFAIPEKRVALSLPCLACPSVCLDYG